MEDWNEKLITAARTGDSGALKLCLQNDADIDYQGVNGWTALMMAASEGHLEICRLLIDTGCKIDITSTVVGQTALMFAAGWGHLEICQLLIDTGCKIDITEKRDGYTALHYAAQYGHLQTTRCLVEQGGASPLVKSHKGKTPYDLAAAEQNGQYKEVMEYLQKMSDPILIKLRQLNRNDFQDLVSLGTFASYENMVYLAGPCNIGKSSLASILIGEEIPKTWFSTEGLIIHFGRNGIDLQQRKMIPLKKGSNYCSGSGDVLTKLLLGNPELKKKPSLPAESKEEVPGGPKSKIKEYQLSSSNTDEGPSYKKRRKTTLTSRQTSSGGQRQLSHQSNQETPKDFKEPPIHTAHSIQDDLLEKIKKGTNIMNIAPSDLVDFGGQKSFDMTHQLFIRHRGTFILMFDGRKGLYTGLAEYPQGDVTAASILEHWINSVLTYCNKTEDKMPRILFAATHSDSFSEDEKRILALKFSEELRTMFSSHKLQKHIMYNTVFFLNATDAADRDIERLKDTLVDIAFQQSTWGQQMPIVWVPLDLQISDMRTDGVKLITKERLLEINKSNNEFALNERRVEDFLLVQHSIGKLLYFDEPALRDFIVIQPSAMVNILRAFITDIMFWPEKGPVRDILENLSSTGVLKKTDLFTLWSQPAFNEILTDVRTKEYIVQVLLHLDILVEPKRYTETDAAADLFLVPCIVKEKIPQKMQRNATDDRTLCIAYHLKETVVPSALSFRLIGAAISIWPLKVEDNRFCLYFQAAILDVDNRNELQIHVTGQKIYAYLINDVSKQLISPDLATTTQECLTWALERILQFYRRCFGKQSHHLMSDLFEIEVGEICNDNTCLIPLADAKKRAQWRCEYGRVHETKCPLNWVFEKNKKHCDSNCKVDVVPTEIALMADRRYVPLYLKLLESGSEKKRDIRLVIVGKKGAGKTLLIKRLFKEMRKEAGIISFLQGITRRKKENITSTNGIEIHSIRCKATVDDDKWEKLDANYGENELNARLLKPYGKVCSKIRTTSEAPGETSAYKITEDETAVKIFEEAAAPKTITNQMASSRFGKSMESDIESQQPENVKPKVESLPSEVNMSIHTELETKPLVTTQLQVENESQLQPPVATHSLQHLPNRSKQQAYGDIEDMLKSPVDLKDQEGYATLLFWDFAGDEEFYHTHQTFLSPDSIYLVVTKLNEAGEKNAGEMFQLWMNSIHCYCSLEDQQNTSDIKAVGIDKSTETDKNYPPVILVGSHKDKVKKITKTRTVDACRRHINRFVNDISPAARSHIDSEFYISNTDDDDSEFQQIRTRILSLAKKTKGWDKKYPLKFIQLEKRLKEKKKELQIPFMSFRDINDISNEIAKPLNQQELMLFLEFHHEMRNLVYFQDIPDFIILDTQWLCDVFKCIVTAEKFQADVRRHVGRHMLKDKLDDLNVRGMLHSDVLNAIFQNNTILYHYHEHKKDILNIMEKFDIIIPSYRENDDVCFFIPCMVKSKPKLNIYKMCNFTDSHWKKSTWLCFKFIFLPPHLMNHLIASFSRQYHITEVSGISKQKKKQIALFRGTVVFDLNASKCEKMLVMAYPKSIQIQVWEFKTKEQDRNLYAEISNFMTQELKNIIHTRFKMSTVKFEKKWECGFQITELAEELSDFESKKQTTEYLCTRCKPEHKFTNEWAPIQNLEPDLESITDMDKTSLTSITELQCDHQSTIRDKRDYIVQHISGISDILDRMMKRMVISVDDRRIIEQDKRQDVQIKGLLDIVIERGGATNNMFIDVLKECGYIQLADNLIKESVIESPSSISGLEDVPDYKIRLKKNYLEIIKKLKHNMDNDQ